MRIVQTSLQWRAISHHLFVLEECLPSIAYSESGVVLGLAAKTSKNRKTEGVGYLRAESLQCLSRKDLCLTLCCTHDTCPRHIFIHSSHVISLDFIVQ